MVTVGWLALIAGVATPPTAAELTFLGADTFTSGLWPWNGIAIVVVALLLIGLAIALARSPSPFSSMAAEPRRRTCGRPSWWA